MSDTRQDAVAVPEVYCANHCDWVGLFEDLNTDEHSDYCPKCGASSAMLLEIGITEEAGRAILRYAKKQATATAPDEVQRLRDALAKAAIPLEVLASQIASVPYAELTEELQSCIVDEVIPVIRAALTATPQPAPRISAEAIALREAVGELLKVDPEEFGNNALVWMHELKLARTAMLEQYAQQPASTTADAIAEAERLREGIRAIRDSRESDLGEYSRWVAEKCNELLESQPAPAADAEPNTIPAKAQIERTVRVSRDEGKPLPYPEEAEPSDTQLLDWLERNAVFSLTTGRRVNRLSIRDAVRAELEAPRG